MKNVKFGVFCLGLVVAIGAAVSTLSAQAVWVAGEPAQGVRVQPRADRNVMVLDGRGAQLGVMVSDPSTRQSPQADSGSLRTGVLVDEVNPDSPAEKAGIKAGDLVVEYDGERVRSARQFTRLVQETPEGRSVKIALMRDGKRQTVDATPESGRMAWNFGPDVDRAMREAERGFHFEMPAMPVIPDVPEMREFHFEQRDRDGNGAPRTFEYRVPGGGMFRAQPRARLGVQVQSLTRDLQEYFGAKNGGALVSSVTPDTAASKAGIKAGDVIVSINGKSVSDADDLMRELGGFEGDATIVVVRDKKEMTLKATIERARPTTPRAGSRPGVNF